MAKPRFNLKNKVDKESLIVMVYRPQKERIVYSTGMKVPPKYWNDNRMRVKETQEFNDFQFVNNQLDKLEMLALKIVKEYVYQDKILTPAAFKSSMDKNLNVHAPSLESGIKNFTEFLNLFIRERSDSNDYAPGTIEVYKTLRTNILKYSKSRKLKFEDLDVNFINGFKKYLQDQKFSDNHVNKNITTLKTILNDATDRGFNKFLEFRSKKISAPKKEVDNVYLTKNELQSINDLTLNNERLDKVRDLFLVGAYTGLRFSDFTKLLPQNVRDLDNGVKAFDISTVKTKDRVIIPIHPIVEKILQKYNNILPDPISNQKMNDYIKELCELAGITATVIKRDFRQGKMKELSSPKYKLVSSHTCRRSFATNAYKEGVPMLSIMRITGHKRPEVFLKYIKFSNEENAQILANHPFFKSNI